MARNSSRWRPPPWLGTIKDLVSSEKWHDLFSYYRAMQMSKAGRLLFLDDESTSEHLLFPPLLKACLALSSAQLGMSIHATSIKQGLLGSFTSVGNSIVDFYLKAGALGSAVRVFDCMKNRDSISWNIIIRGHLYQGSASHKLGIGLFLKGRVAGFVPDVSTLVLLLQASRYPSARHTFGRQIHGYLTRNGLSTVLSVQNSLLCFYTEVGMEFALQLFDEMRDRDVISWTAMIGGYAQAEEGSYALEMFREMVSNFEVPVDGILMVGVLKACIHCGETEMAHLVHCFLIPRGLNSDVFVGNSLVDLYSKLNDIGSAFKAFCEVPLKNLVTWNSFLSGLVHNKKFPEAFTLLGEMKNAGVQADEVTIVNMLQIFKYFIDQNGCKSLHARILRKGHESNEVVANSLLGAYATCNLLTLAWRLFCMLEKPDVVTWSTTIAAFAHSGLPNEAITIFCLMSLTDEQPNVVVMLHVIEACSLSLDVQRSKCAHGIAIRRGMYSDVGVGTAILDMYSKYGAVETSRKVFDTMTQRNIVTWSAMISAYGMNSLPHDALNLLGEMRACGLWPNSVTILSVLSACSHGGLVDQGLSLFEEWVRNHRMELRSEHCACLVDLLARAGKIESAKNVIEMLPDQLKPGASAWGAILSACRNYGDCELGASACSHVLKLEPSSSAGYFLASNMFAAGGYQAEAAKMRWLARERRVSVTAGYSLINVDNIASRFVSGEKLLLSEEVSLVIRQLHSCMEEDERGGSP